MRILFLFIFSSLSVSLLAQTPLRNANAAMTYRIKSLDGNNACTVTYNAKLDLYYTAFAGNTNYPLEVFDAKGQNKYSSTLGIDTRSLWYDSKKKVLMGYAYPKKGKFTIGLSKTGMPETLKETVGDFPEIPNEQSTPSLVGKKLYYFDGSSVYVLNASNLKEKSRFGLKAIPGDINNLNNTTLIYTGVSGYELGFYDFFEGKIYFTDLKGNYSGSTLLPSSAPKASSFKFAYANKKAWLYNADERIWHSYWIFN